MQLVFSFFKKKYKKSLTKRIIRYYNKNVLGVMAQLVERLVRNEEASGSNPLSSTTKKDGTIAVFFRGGNKQRSTTELTAVRANNVRKRKVGEKSGACRRCEALAVASI